VVARHSKGKIYNIRWGGGDHTPQHTTIHNIQEHHSNTPTPHSNNPTDDGDDHEGRKTPCLRRQKSSFSMTTTNQSQWLHQLIADKDDVQQPISTNAKISDKYMKTKKRSLSLKSSEGNNNSLRRQKSSFSMTTTNQSLKSKSLEGNINLRRQRSSNSINSTVRTMV
jgi:hypothetical protein